MSKGDDGNNDNNNNKLYSIGVSFLLLIFFVQVFVGIATLPSNNNNGNGISINNNNNNNLSTTGFTLGDAVAVNTAKVEQDKDPMMLKNNNMSFERLTRSKIEQKLSLVPVFYVTNTAASATSTASASASSAMIMQPEIYMSYREAQDAAKTLGSDSSSYAVKVTSLDQVMYSLVLKRGRMPSVFPSPLEVRMAQESILAGEEGVSFKLVPSQKALRDAKAENTEIENGDVPLFAADRLAFAGRDLGSVQVPLFLEKDDCVESYKNLRASKGSGSSTTLPEEPVIRMTTLKDELNSMEFGTRPRVSQLEFYPNAEDAIEATNLFEKSS